MPYLQCPGCRLSLYSAASHSWIADECPVCGASLLGAVKQFAGADGARTLCREFPSAPQSVESARRALDGFHAELGDSVHEKAMLLISELVTNSVEHSKVSNGTIELLACMTPRSLRIEVSDDGEGFDPPPIARDDDDAGRGLHLVQELADRWGWPTGLRTSVWFEVDRVAAGAVRSVAVVPEPAAQSDAPATPMRAAQ
ncbi:MAG: phosphoserine phosphatase RsbU/P [Thermoleophilaceae bacterium]|nr:phosphoserine phosphatase RsbU/P [Thermoleophilaceae bacterium]